MGQLVKFLRAKYMKVERRSNYTSEPDDDIDRISYLPDELRVHILSFLRIKEAVQTCVLSKTWKNTWACLPMLSFDLREFLLDYPDQRHSCETAREYEDKFEKIVKAVLQNQASDLSHFVLISILKDCVSCNPEVFKGCILRALEFKPRFLALFFVCKDKLLSSYEIFTCASLQEVLLWSKGDGNFEIAPTTVHLPCLKMLFLVYVTVNDDFLDKIFLGCPVIEKLYLHGCILNASRISSGRLKKLALSSCDFSKSGPGLINNLSNVTSLKLNLPGTEAKEFFEKGVPHWPIFKNLKKLRLGGWCLNSDFKLVAFFLRSPNLQSLMLHGCNPRKVVTEDKSNWKEPKVVMVQREHLEEVKIIKGGNSDEWIDRLIKNLQAHVKTIGETKLVQILNVRS